MSAADAADARPAFYRLGPRTLVLLERTQIDNFTDPMTNQTSLGRTDVLAMLKATTPHELTLSDQGLRFLLHECTHHGSFANNVGYARSALATSVCGRASMGAPPAGRAGLWLAQRDDLLLRFFEVVFEPLIEGLALFSEHDTRWGKSPNASHPLLHLWSLFLNSKAQDVVIDALNESKEKETLDPRRIYEEWINAYLSDARTRDYWVEQKERLLRQPLFGAKGPAYLLGYMAIKRVYLVLRRVNRGYIDADSFLLILLGYWFSDEQTAELLCHLQDTDLVTVQSTIAALSERFQDMWDDLYKQPSKAALHVFSHMQASATQGLDELGRVGLGIGVRIAAESLHISVPRFYKYRLVLRIGMVRVNISFKSRDTQVVVRDTKTSETLLECPGVPLADTGDFPGSLEIIRTYDGTTTVVAVLGGSGLIAVRELFSEEWNDPRLVEMFDDLPSFEYVEASAKAYKRSVFARRWEEDDFRETDRRVMDQAVELCKSTYLQLAFPRFEKTRRDRAEETLIADGLQDLFPNTTDCSELALLSLHFGGAGTSIDVVAKKLERPIDEVMARLQYFNECSQRKLGIDLFEIEGSVVTASI